MGWRNYPRAVFPTLLMEFCQALAFYGTQIIYTVYMIRWLGFDDSTTMAIYHTNNVLVYVFSIVGGAIADAWLGKYRTLLVTSIIYTMGYITISATSVPPKESYGFLVGLVLVAIGASGVKPLIPAIGADQFTDNQLKEKDTFFSSFYIFRNLGAFLGLFFLPIVRSYIHCYDNTCYPVAFGIPAGCMLMGTVFFSLSKSLYRNIPATGGIMSKFFGCLCTLVKTRWSIIRQKDHSMDHIEQDYDVTFIKECKGVLRVLVMMTPWPFYWALYEQIGSLWVIQAAELDGQVGSLIVEPDQLSASNSLLIVMFVPLFQYGVYPVLDRLKIPNRLLQRVTAGMFIACVSFVLAGILTLVIANTNPTQVAPGSTELYYINSLPCDLNISSNGNHPNIDLLATTRSDKLRLETMPQDVSFENSGCGVNVSFNLANDCEGKRISIIISNTPGELVVRRLWHSDTFRTPNGLSGFRVFNALNDTLEISLERGDNTVLFHHLKPLEANDNYRKVDFGRYTLNARRLDNSSLVISTEVDLANGARYTALLQYKSTLQGEAVLFEDISPYQLSIMWMLIQYVALSLAETLFSVNSLDFTYGQAPPRMKGVMTGFYMLTIAIGNIIVTILAKVMYFDNMSTTFFVYAGLEGLALVVFVLLTLQYTYETYGMDVVVEVDSQDDSEEGNQKGHDNYAFENGDLKPVGTGIALQKDHEVTVAKF